MYKKKNPLNRKPFDAPGAQIKPSIQQESGMNIIKPKPAMQQGAGMLRPERPSRFQNLRGSLDPFKPAEQTSPAAPNTPAMPANISEARQQMPKIPARMGSFTDTPKRPAEGVVSDASPEDQAKFAQGMSAERQRRMDATRERAQSIGRKMLNEPAAQQPGIGPLQQEQDLKKQLMPDAGNAPMTAPMDQSPAQDSSGIDQQIAALQKQIADLQAQKK